MKILFVCWANVGRSQMAAALYNSISGKQQAHSAGTQVDCPGETLVERRNRVGDTYTIDVMDSINIDVRDSKRTQLTQAMLKDYDLIISMAQKQYTPQWLESNGKYQYWDVRDPGGKDYATTLEALEDIKPRVEALERTLQS